MGSKCKTSFLGPSKGTSLCETMTFDVLTIKIGAEGLALEKRKNPEKNYPAESLCTHCSMHGGVGAKTHYRIIIKFCRRVEFPDVVTHAKLSDHRFWDFGDSGRQISHFSLHFIDLRCRP